MVVIVITGVPATGKTTISKKLAEILKAKYINVTEYAKQNGFVLEYDKALQTYIIDEDKTIESLVNLIKNNKDKNFVIEGTFAHLLPKDVVDFYIVLRADPNILYKRMKERDYPYHKIFENIWAQNLEVIEDELESERKKYFVIYTTENTIEDVIKKILELVKKANKK